MSKKLDVFMNWYNQLESKSGLDDKKHTCQKFELEILESKYNESNSIQ
jgi:hypothetical protein